MWTRFQVWWRTQSALKQWGWVSLAVAVVFGASLRFVNLGPAMQFQADQGRDALVAYGILRGDIALVGPSTSVGSMFLGPLYYYFMAPFILLFGFNPVGPTAAVALIGTLTIPVLFWFVRKLFGTAIATWSVLLYAAAPWVVEYTRFSWNPNPAPVVALALWWSGWQAWHGKTWHWAVVGFWLAVLMQLHYVALLAVAPLGLIWLWEVFQQVRAKDWKNLRKQIGWSVLAGLIVVASTLPLVVFDIRFNGLIRNGFGEFFSPVDAPQYTVPEKLVKIVREQEGRSLYVFAEFWGGHTGIGEWRDAARVILLAALVIWILFGFRLRKLQQGRAWVFVTLTAWTTILGLSWYRGVVYAHYITYFFPIVVLLCAAVILELRMRWSAVGGAIAAGLLSLCILLSLQERAQYFYQSVGWQYTDMERIAHQVLQEVPEGRSYALTLLSEIRDYRGLNYRYFLQISNRTPVPLEISHTADYLVILAESPSDPTNVLGSPVYEIVTFPRGEYRVVEPAEGPKIYVIENSQKAEELPQP